MTQILSATLKSEGKYKPAVKLAMAFKSSVLLLLLCLSLTVSFVILLEIQHPEMHMERLEKADEAGVQCGS